MFEYLHTKRLWLVRVKFLENGLYLLCNVLTTSSTEKDIGAENPEATTVSGFFHADF